MSIVERLFDLSIKSKIEEFFEIFEDEDENEYENDDEDEDEDNTIILYALNQNVKILLTYFEGSVCLEVDEPKYRYRIFEWEQNFHPRRKELVKTYCLDYIKNFINKKVCVRDYKQIDEDKFNDNMNGDCILNLCDECETCVPLRIYTHLSLNKEEKEEDLECDVCKVKMFEPILNCDNKTNFNFTDLKQLTCCKGKKICKDCFNTVVGSKCTCDTKCPFCKQGLVVGLELSSYHKC